MAGVVAFNHGTGDWWSRCWEDARRRSMEAHRDSSKTAGASQWIPGLAGFLRILKQRLLGSYLSDFILERKRCLRQSKVGAYIRRVIGMARPHVVYRIRIAVVHGCSFAKKGP